MMGYQTEMPSLSYVSPGRYICTVFEEMRECIKRLNFAPMKSLIEEAQILANRMESALDAKGGIDAIMKDLRALRNTRDELEEEVACLIVERDKLLEEKCKIREGK